MDGRFEQHERRVGRGSIVIYSRALSTGILALSAAAVAAAPGAGQGVAGTVDFRGRAAGEAVIELVPTADAQAVLASNNSVTRADTLMIDQRHLRFAPNVIAVAPGTVVEFRNSDPILHNVFSPPRLGADFDLGTYPQDESRLQRFDAPGNYVILCHVHPEMAAWVIVGRSPYVAVADEEGSFTVSNVEPGAYAVRVWFRRREFDGGTVTVGALDTTAHDVSLGPRPAR